MLHIRDNFGEGPVTQVPASWYNAVAKFINNLIGGHRVKVEKFADGTPSSISFVDDEKDAKYGEKTTPGPTHGTSIIPDFTKSDDTNLDRTEDKMYSDITGEDGTTPAGWERGKTAYRNGHVVDADHPAVGCSITVCTHSYLWGRGTSSDPQRTVNFFSRLDFDENGLLVRVVPCDHWHRDKL